MFLYPLFLRQIASLAIEFINPNCSTFYRMYNTALEIIILPLIGISLWWFSIWSIIDTDPIDNFSDGIFNQVFVQCFQTTSGLLGFIALQTRERSNN